MADNPHAIRAQAARAVIAERFLAAVQSEPEPVEGPLAFPGYVSMRTCRMLLDGTLNVVINVPQSFAAETYTQLTKYAELPLTATVEPIILPDIPDA